MVTVTELLAQGTIKDLPPCDECKLTKEQIIERDGPHFMLASFNGRLVCGRCCVMLSTPKKCLCGTSNPYSAKFCSNCGEKFEGSNGLHQKP